MQIHTEPSGLWLLSQHRSPTSLFSPRLSTSLIRNNSSYFSHMCTLWYHPCYSIHLLYSHHVLTSFRRPRLTPPPSTCLQPHRSKLSPRSSQHPRAYSALTIISHRHRIYLPIRINQDSSSSRTSSPTTPAPFSAPLKTPIVSNHLILSEDI